MVRPADLEPIQGRMKEIPANLVVKCPGCGTMLVTKDYVRDLHVCARCGHNGRLTARERVDILVEEFHEWDKELAPRDPLTFPDYATKKSSAQLKTGAHDSLLSGKGMMNGRPIALAASDFAWMGGSMGSVFGERLTRLFERALQERLPVITATSTGGASFASLGDLLIAEPGALIGFTGARIIEQNFRVKLPKDFQTAEFQLAHGQIDLIIPRAKLKEELSTILGLLMD